MITNKNKPHEHYMARCIELAKIARDRGDSPAGSLIVKDDEIIGEGIEGGKTHNDITFHAEIEAIRQATELLRTQDLSGCTLYTTHEPCIMCSFVIRHTQIDTIVSGSSTGEIGGFSSELPLLLDTSVKRWKTAPQVITGILEGECRKL